MALYNSVEELIGNTPLVRLNRFEEKYQIKAHLYAKLEMFNPAGSIKDRAALSMVKDALDRGLIKKGSTIIEPTSGNTGIGLALVARLYGLRLILTMPESMSMERRALLKARGAELVLTPAADGMKGAVSRAEEIHKSVPGSIIVGQFENPANPLAHEKTTAKELWKDLDGKIDAVVAGIGTGGTITGVGRYLKERKPDVKIIGVEPSGSPVLSSGKAGPHKIQGIGPGFVPLTLDTGVYDEIITIDNEDAFEEGKNIARNEGILVGISSGAALKAASIVASRPENAGKTIVVLLPDNGDRYLSTPMFLN